MKTLNLEKLIKEGNALITEINPEKKYFIVVSKHAITIEALRNTPKNLRNCTFMLVDGKPDEVISMYEIKE